MPIVSIIVGAYNCQDSIKSSLESIKDQTYNDWECIICDDGSKDGTWNALEEIADNDGRFILLKNKNNLGLAATLNRCIEHAKGEYLARHDADDVSLPERIEKQVAFLDKHPDVSVLGTYAELYSEKDGVWGVLKRPLQPSIKDWIIGSSVIHASVLMRKDDVLSMGGYDPTAIRVEDYDLWLRMVAKGYKIITMPDVLYRIYADKQSYKRKQFRYRLNEAKVKFNALKRLNAPLYFYFFVLKPILVGLIPSNLLFKYHSLKFKNNIYSTKKTECT
ncbi:MAG: glycosyltransferase family 2 protein [Syntrophorhabdaceae bacterium]|nr:glycosyltransferase family 2 protein [Syntrophorhabdaceae bacterium]